MRQAKSSSLDPHPNSDVVFGSAGIPGDVPVDSARIAVPPPFSTALNRNDQARVSRKPRPVQGEGTIFSRLFRGKCPVSDDGALQVDIGVHHCPPSGAQPLLEVFHDRTMPHVPVEFGDELLIADQVAANSSTPEIRNHPFPAVLGEFGPCGIVGGMQFHGRSGLRCLAIARHGRRLAGPTDTRGGVILTEWVLPLPWEDGPGHLPILRSLHASKSTWLWAR